MKIFLCAAACIFVFNAPASAQTASESASVALLMDAAKKAKQFSQYRYAYTVDYWMSDGEKEFAATLRFDPRLEKEERWTVLAPDESALDKDARKTLKKMRKNEGGDEPILYDGLDEIIGSAELVSETETDAVFLAQIDDDEAPKDALEVLITLDKTGGYVSSIELRSKQPFKPAPVAKVNSLIQTQHFSAPDGNGPALIATSESRVEGEAMFKSFNNHARQTFSDIEVVELPAASSGD